jgi:predicted phage tail protein
VDTVGNKNTGQTVTKTADGAVSSVSGLTGTLNSGARVTLAWTKPLDADLDHIEITWSPGGSFPVSVPKETQTYTTADSALTHGTEYTFTVKTVDALGNENSKTVTETANGTPPGAVGSLTGTPGSGEVSLFWTDPTDADLDHIEITFSPAAAGLIQPITVAKGTGTRIVTGLTNGTAYTFTVKAVDAAGNKSSGEDISKTPLAPTGLVRVELGGLPEDEEITLTGPENTLSWFDNTQLTISVSETFTAYRWILDGAVLAGETGASLSLSAGNLAVKKHYVTVFVKKTNDGPEYAKRVNFTVEP